MTFSWINLFNLIIVVLLIIPNVIVTVRNKGKLSASRFTAINIIRHISILLCIVCMLLPIIVGKFGFGSPAALVIYFICAALILIAYYTVFFLYLAKKTPRRAAAFSIIPTCIFLLCEISLHHWILAAAAVIYAAAYIITLKTKSKQ